MTYEQLIRNYPPLFHYTAGQSIMPLLMSKGLLARPTSNFHDTEEYLLGLRLILARLKSPGLQAEIVLRLEASSLAVLRGHFGNDLSDLVGQVIALLEYEVSNGGRPNIEVYVACLSEAAASPRMIKDYGGAIIGFNFLLPLVAYSRPLPFYSSMLSRVTYDEHEFTHRIVQMGFNILWLMSVAELTAALVGMAPQQRRQALALWVAEALCMFAPNIKAPSFAHEREWRLKSVLSRHGAQSLGNKRSRGDRHALGLPPSAEFTAHDPQRYLHRLDAHGRVVAGEISLTTDDAKVHEREVAEWQRGHSMGPLNLDDSTMVLRNFLSKSAS